MADNNSIRPTDGQIVVQRVLVTPERAAEWLSKNEANRLLRRSSVLKMTNDMESGLWIETNPQPVIFDTSGALIDGQHRLSALAKSGRTLWLWVAENVPRHTQLVIDDHIRRQIHDFAKWEMPGHAITPKHAACARVMLSGITRSSASTVTRSYLYRFMRDHLPAIEFALGLFSKRIAHITTSTTHGVIARAFFSQDPVRLRRFAEVLESGLTVDETETAAVLVSRWLLERSRKQVREIYAKTERGLKSFLDGQQLKNLIAAKEELFLLPSEIRPTVNAVNAEEDTPIQERPVSAGGHP
jgi:hypothetical protein